MPEVITKAGTPLNLGATITPNGVNFSIYSKDATAVSLCLFESDMAAKPYAVIAFDPAVNKTGDIWHIELCGEGLGNGTLYLYKVDGPYEPTRGLRFNKNKYLFDPYAKAFTIGSVFRSYNKQHRMGFSANEGGELQDLSDFPKCVVVDDSFDWEGDKPLNYPLEKTVIYETHLKGFTASGTSGVAPEIAGTYKGFTQKAEYLRDLGITAVELLPVFEFDENETANSNPKTGETLVNYWGYSTIGFFAPKTGYAADRTPGGPVREFKQMVKELHRAGIEVILDVVYNHTAEGNERGYAFEFRGLQNDVYYSLPQNDKQYYMNFSGCGNSVNCNHPVTAQFILDSLRYWVLQMHVDGFRFDLASILTRAPNGSPIPYDMPSLTASISQDPVLANTKIIAEPWDCAGLYQLGGFPGGCLCGDNRWSEWNGRFRDDIRRFIRGDDDATTAAATRIAGSSDAYNHSGRAPTASINFITAHDGFTLNDLVTYNHKHNEENGEENRDGSDDNLSYNNGFEGECTNPKIQAQRIRKIKNFLIYLMVSQGVPMLLGGDEMRRTQGGNNNAYCQDNEISWFDWNLAQKNAGLVRFTKNLIAYRKAHNVFCRTKFFTDCYDKDTVPEIAWYDINAKNPDWSKQKRFLAFKLNGAVTGDSDFYIATNTDIYDLTITLPALSDGRQWYLVSDTSLDSPEDIAEPTTEELLREQRRYVLLSGATVVLIGK
ncbi:MAG: glycogen debranching protein GlgX [Treponema sp.]|nr:glycogen debranching protein GlgX [Treponema sp.]